MCPTTTKQLVEDPRKEARKERARTRLIVLRESKTKLRFRLLSALNSTEVPRVEGSMADVRSGKEERIDKGDVEVEAKRKPISEAPRSNLP